MTIVPATHEGIQQAAQVIRSGGIAAYPTETVYGLGADPFSEEAIELLFSIKERPRNNPVLLIIAEPEDVYQVAAEVSPRAQRYIEKFWPGPLSLVLPRRLSISDAVTAGRGKVCVRCPACETARALCRFVGGPITSTSANRSGDTPAGRLRDIDVPAVTIGIDGGTLPPSAPSTVFDPDLGQVLREGAIPAEALLGLSFPDGAGPTGGHRDRAE